MKRMKINYLYTDERIKINGKDYLGSTSNAKSRLSTYFNLNTLKLANMPTDKAILKYGHSNFDF
uniref:GIY-YIG domain-containing protein n=1 Tax=Mutinus fleischeri TaxID=2218478 RepID=A0A8K1RCF2_9AGAM|nr:hypothetical protein [Mutinus fleischeri]